MMMQKLKNDLAAIENSHGKVWRVVAHDPDYRPGSLSREQFMADQVQLVTNLKPGEEIFSILHGHFARSKNGDLIVNSPRPYDFNYGADYYSR